MNGIPAVDERKDDAGVRAGEIVMDVLRRNLRPLDVLTRAAFENAIAGVAATGGSTNAVLHLLALAREANVPLTIDDFDTVSTRTPLIADLRPGGRYLAADLDKAGGMELVAKRLVEARHARRHATDAERALAGRGGRSGARDAGAGCRRDRRAAAEEDGRARHPEGEPRARGLRDQGRRTRAAGAPRPGARLRPRGRGDERRHGEPHQARRCRRHPLRRAEGRPRHARDARRDVGASSARGWARRWRC